jgi:hypothetical protein
MGADVLIVADDIDRTEHELTAGELVTRPSCTQQATRSTNNRPRHCWTSYPFW